MWNRCLAVAFAVSSACAFAQLTTFNTTLPARTTEAFESYLKANEPQMTGKTRFAQLKPDEVRVEPAKDDGTIPVKGGMIHDWVAATLVPKATVAQALAVLKNYQAYPSMYKPDIIDSKVLSRDGEHWRLYLKMVKTKVFTTVLNSEYDVNYHDLGGGKWTMTSRSTKIAEVQDKKELPVGTGQGFLWRLNAYWTLEQRPEGVYMECRAISLSRDIPFGFGSVVGPLVNSVPTDSLRMTMDSTAQALGRRLAAR